MSVRFNATTVGEVTEKLRKASENTPKVYNAGFSAGVQSGEESGYAAGFEEGKKAEYDSFWDIFQQNGTRVRYERVFAETGSGMLWRVGTTYRPKYPIVPTRADEMYDATRLPYDALKEVDFSNCTSFRQTFAYASTPRLGVIDARKATNFHDTFAWSSAITTIDKLIFAETTPIINAFTKCTKLANIVVEGTIGVTVDFKDCPLTKDSITSVVNALSSSASGKTATFNKAAVNSAFETSEGANDGEASAEWTALLSTKTNWTFTLL